MQENNKGLIEAILFIENKAVDIGKIAEYLQIAVPEARNLITELNFEYDQRNSGIQINEVANGFIISTRQEYAEKLKQIYRTKEKPRLTKVLLETLAIIAYKQPITSAEICAIRGVTDIGNSIKALLERKLIKILGRKKIAGNPLLYGTTKEFLLYFGLKDIDALPTIKEIREMDLE